MKWQAPIWIAVMAWVSVGVAEASPESAHVERALSPSAIGEHLAEQAGADHRLDWKEPGVAQLQAPMQDLVAEVDRLGLSLISDSEDEPGQLRLQPSYVGRGALRHPMGAGEVSVQGSVVRLGRPGLTEEFTTSSQGIRQDFVFPERLPGSAPLRLELQLEGATAEPHEDGVRLRLDTSGRELDYARLLITDATGQALSGRFEVMGEHLVVIQVQDDAARYPIRIDPTFTDSQWQSLAMPFAEGTNSVINALAWDSANGHLYAGGAFTTAAGVPANRVARWDGTNWTGLSGGVNRAVHALAWDGANGHLYAGGEFTTAGGAPANRVARWDGTNWTNLGGGVSDGEVWALAWNSTDGFLYVGGELTGVDGVPDPNNIVQWNGIGWSSLQLGTNRVVWALAWDGANGDLYVGGDFTTAGGMVANRIARWRPAGGGSFSGDWFALGSGMNNDVSALAWDGVNGHLYAGGDFTTAGGAPATRMARWDGSSWSALGVGVDAVVSSLAWDGANGHLYVGGRFTTAGGAPASRIARWDGSAWSALGSGVNEQVRALIWDGAGGDLYAGGGFFTAGGALALRIARWDGGAWSVLGSGVNDDVRALAWDGANGHLYAGTTFVTGGGAVFSHMIRWDGSVWSPLGSGMDSPVLALAWDGVNGHLYAGGEFTTAGGVPASRIARWDGVTWSALGLGLDDEVQDLAWDGANGHLYAGGTFTTAGGAPADRIAQWDGSSWSALGLGLDDEVRALAWDGASGDLYAGGTFITAGGAPANRIALWDGTAWSALGTGMNALVTALAWDSTNEHLFAGGAFASAGGVGANRIACWDGTAWVPLGSGTSPGPPLALVWDGANGHLYAGGSFTSAGNQAARVARANLGVAFATATDGTGSGNTTGSTPDGAYFEGTTITLVATPAADSDFAGWSPATCIDGFSLAGTTTCTATFTLKTYTFATAIAGTGSGTTVGSTPDGTYDHGTPITLVATPDPGSDFAGWSPASCVDGFSLEANTTCTAEFTLRTYPIVTEVIPSGSGTVTCSPNPVAHGANANCTATANFGFVFDQFSGDCVGLTCDLNNVTAPQTVTAEFIIEDFDGVPAVIENAGPNFGDGNDDGIPDAEQSDVASLPAAHGGGYLSVELSGACSQLHEVQTSVAVTPDPAGYAYPLGLLGFSLPCETATVTVLYHGIESLPGLTYRKHGPNPPGSASSMWYTLPGAEFGTTSVFGESVATATFDLADNAIGDATGDDGQIVDPGGPGLLFTAIPTLGPLGLVILALLIGAAGISIRYRSG